MCDQIDKWKHLYKHT